MDWLRYSNPRMLPRFDPCFSHQKIGRFRHLIPAAYQAMREITRNSTSTWPRRVECMTRADIAEGLPYGAGHGLYLRAGGRVKINPCMSAPAIFANFIHEHLHHLRADWSERQVDRATKQVYERVRGNLQPWSAHESRPDV